MKNRHRTARTENPENAEKIIKDDNAEMSDDADAWRLKIKYFIPGADKTEASIAKKEFKNEAKSYRIVENVEGSKTRTGFIIFNRRHFRKHYRRWECSDSDSHFTDNCNKEFNKLHDAQDGAEDSDESLVAVKDPKKRRFEDKGVEVRTGGRQTGPMSAESFDAFDRKVQKRLRKCSTPEAEEADDEVSEAVVKKTKSSIDGESLAPSTLKFPSRPPSNATTRYVDAGTPLRADAAKKEPVVTSTSEKTNDAGKKVRKEAMIATEATGHIDVTKVDG